MGVLACKYCLIVSRRGKIPHEYYAELTHCTRALQKSGCSQLDYPAACGPKGHVSEQYYFTWSFPYPITVRRHPRQHTGYHAVLVGPLLPSSSRRTYGKRKEQRKHVQKTKENTFSDPPEWVGGKWGSHNGRNGSNPTFRSH